MMSKLLSLVFFSLISFGQGPEVIDARSCQKDKQIRLVLVKKDKSKFTTVFYKQNEELVSGRFTDAESAIQAMEKVADSLKDLEWTCKPIVAEYLDW